MPEPMIVQENVESAFKVCHDSIHVKTAGCLQFVDLTDLLAEIVERSGIRYGTVNVQTRHTTAAIAVNENEPLLLEDLRATLERLAPHEAPYRHDDFTIRTVNREPLEHDNGHSHCKALFLRAAETLNILDAQIQLGRWQRVFLIELDRARERRVSVLALGV